jgi:hypothetical protein
VKCYKPTSPAAVRDWLDGLQAQSASRLSTRITMLTPPVAGFQIRTAPSQLALASRVPSEASATALSRAHLRHHQAASVPDETRARVT